ncbi:sulfite exporter TauE/SafE family protein [Vibrio sp. JC009]|uniref:sulfite exporter TauE/SafE family protein n=1 Tax=Vibrio sp. JC009 TaxID=2912314 RepID=UPI0023AF88AB|nr:sulfite exporter TauE/SafE family protein [Vibrio sp. JC009]WED23359.1 sulfite exporter TauE/SafE family protein [Vibrio sp. JC009]
MEKTILFESILITTPVVALAALVRGYAGFGFAAIAVVGLNLFLSPQQSIPLILGLDVLCSAGLWRQARCQADIPTFKVLTIGSLLGIPMGLSLLLIVPEDILKLLICIAILLFSLVLLFDFQLRSTEGLGTKLSFGMASGLGTAGASVGGPMIVCYMLSSPLSPSAQRATMILFFIISELLALGALFISGLVDLQVVQLLLILLLPTLLSVRAGQWLFNRYPPKSLKHFALPILVMISVLGISASLNTLI